MTANTLRKKRWNKTLQRRRIHKAMESNIRAPKYVRLEQSKKDQKNHEHAR